MIIFAVILFQIILIIYGSNLLLKKLNNNASNKIQVKVEGNSINSEIIRDGIKSAIQELAQEKEQDEWFIKKHRQSEQIYSNVANDVPVKHSGGYLVPFNLTDEEKTILEMFYKD